MELTQIFLFFVAVCLINSILCLNKTAYLLVLSIFLFLMAGVFLFFLELEFLAVAFILIYIGGIAIIFMFLMMVLESKIEASFVNFLDYSWLKYSVIASVIMIFFYEIIMFYYSPLMFNSILFNQHDLLMAYSKKKASAFFLELPVDVFQHIRFSWISFYYSPKLYYAGVVIHDIFFNSAFYWFFGFRDVFILGAYIFSIFSLEVLAMSVFLFVATIVAISICSTVFKK